jgi:hypothetical protein
MARQCSCGHDDTKPGEVANDTSAKHIIAPARGDIKGKPDSSGRSSRLSMAETLGAGGEGAESTEKQLGRLIRLKRIYNFDAPCLFLHHLPTVPLHFMALLCIFQN